MRRGQPMAGPLQIVRGPMGPYHALEGQYVGPGAVLEVRLPMGAARTEDGHPLGNVWLRVRYSNWNPRDGSKPSFDFHAAAHWGNDDLYTDERSEEHTSELQSQFHLVCRLLLEK